MAADLHVVSVSGWYNEAGWHVELEEGTPLPPPGARLVSATVHAVYCVGGRVKGSPLPTLRLFGVEGRAPEAGDVLFVDGMVREGFSPAPGLKFAVVEPVRREPPAPRVLVRPGVAEGLTDLFAALDVPGLDAELYRVRAVGCMAVARAVAAARNLRELSRGLVLLPGEAGGRGVGPDVCDDGDGGDAA